MINKLAYLCALGRAYYNVLYNRGIQEIFAVLQKEKLKAKR